MPVSRNIGMNTMQMHSVDTSAGTAICSAPSRMAASTLLPCSRCQLMFSMATVASSTRMPTASARPPSVMMLMVSPSQDSMMIEASTDSGIEIVMISVLRHEPRNSRIIRPVSAAAITPSRTTPSTAARTKVDWSPSSFTLRSLGRPAWMPGSSSWIWSMMLSVDALPVLSTLISTARWPSTRTILVCGAAPSRTCATSRMASTPP